MAAMAMVLALGSGAGATPIDDAFLIYGFNGDFADAGANNLDAIPNNPLAAPTFTDRVAGNGAVVLDGTQHLTVPNMGLSAVSGFTMATRFRLDNANNGYPYLFLLDSYVPNQGSQLYLASAATSLGMDGPLWPNATHDTLAGAVSAAVGQWHHAAFVRDGANLTLYYDGSVLASTTSSGHETDTLLFDQSVWRIGAYRDGGFNFIGALDDTGFWNRALSSAEVLTLSQSTVGSSPVPEPALAAVLGLSGALASFRPLRPRPRP